VDTFAKDLHTALKARNLTDIVDIVFVSDHGMTDTSHPEWVYLDDILDAEAIKSIEHEDGMLKSQHWEARLTSVLGWPSMGLRFSANSNSTSYLNLLVEASAKSNGKFDVYTHETMPARYHFSNNPRIAPIYVIPREGYALTTRDRGESGMSKGVSCSIVVPAMRILIFRSESWL
jgi:predicted AlkP superfamily pyrophosphatase or phosphodiesterase